jgi:hypothetical protein
LSNKRISNDITSGLGKFETSNYGDSAGLQSEARKRLAFACARGLEQFLDALAPLFEIETKLGIGSERVGHDGFPYRLPAFAQADKGWQRGARLFGET